ncbi:hypothetical protein pb186bvf_014722 [Paramecium bursaria]
MKCNYSPINIILRYSYFKIHFQSYYDSNLLDLIHFNSRSLLSYLQKNNYGMIEFKTQQSIGRLYFVLIQLYINNTSRICIYKECDQDNNGVALNVCWKTSINISNQIMVNVKWQQELLTYIQLQHQEYNLTLNKQQSFIQRRLHMLNNIIQNTILNFIIRENLNQHPIEQKTKLLSLDNINK